MEIEKMGLFTDLEPMRVLIACEFSAIVRNAFEMAGHDATSCDFEPTEWPGKHYRGDVRDIMNNGFDLMIAHPPCTFLCNAQLHLCTENSERKANQKLAIQFVQDLMSAKIPRICIENPRGILSRHIGQPTQVVTPWYFGSVYDKDICLWLKNLPLLKQTHFVKGHKKMKNHVNSRMTKEERNKIKSRFFPEVAMAMAEQWGALKRATCPAPVPTLFT